MGRGSFAIVVIDFFSSNVSRSLILSPNDQLYRSQNLIFPPLSAGHHKVETLDRLWVAGSPATVCHVHCMVSLHNPITAALSNGGEIGHL